MKRAILALAAVGLTLTTACDGFKEALTAHVDVAARAGKQELSVDRLGTMLSKVKTPATPAMARSLANVWVDYQLLGQAAASGDSLDDPKVIDDALWPVITQERLGKWHDTLMARDPVDTSSAEAQYAAGAVLGASHILFTVPQGASPAVRDSVRRQAAAVRRKVTSANFAEMARKYSKDPGSAQRGGSLGVFPRGVMVKPFEQAVLALEPGQISQLVETPFGYHIIRRAPYAEVEDQVKQRLVAAHVAQADSVYVSQLVQRSNVAFKDDAVAAIKDAGKDLDAHRDDRTVLATSAAGNFTLGRFVRWLDLYQDKARIAAGLQEAPDSLILQFAKDVMQRELVLHEVDSAKVTLDSAQVADLHTTFAQLIGTAWQGLGVDPKSLADSAKTEGARQRLAAARVDSFLDKLMVNQVRFVQVGGPIEVALRETYDWDVSPAGLEHAVKRAAEIRATADSAAAAKRPATAVPIGPTKAPKPTPDSAAK